MASLFLLATAVGCLSLYPAPRSSAQFGTGNDFDHDISVTRRPNTSGGSLTTSPAAEAPKLQLDRAALPDRNFNPDAGEQPALTIKPPPGNGNARVGRAFALNNCRPCHNIAERGNGSARFANAPDFRSIANDRGMTPFRLNTWLTSPHPTMPRLQLTEAESRNVIAYIMSMRR